MWRLFVECLTLDRPLRGRGSSRRPRVAVRGASGTVGDLENVGRAELPTYRAQVETSSILTRSPSEQHSEEGAHRMSDQEIIDAMLYSGLDDWVMLHDIVAQSTRRTISAEGRSTVVRVIRRLFSEGLMVPGDLAGAGFVDWPAPVEAWVERCLADLDRLHWSPMGEGAWFRLTEKGEQIALKIYPPPDLV